jgi:hypothetical protein
MSIYGESLVDRERVELASVRLRQPQRLQMAMMATCPDDLVSATHPVRMLQGVVERLDLKPFYEPIQARRGVAGRDATDPRLLLALWLYACTRGIGSARVLARHTVDIEQAHANGVELFMPPKTAKSPKNRGRELEPEAGDSEAVLAWKQRMSGKAGEQIYKQRAATSETVNADLRSYRGLGQITVRGLAKAQCVALWCALAYNILHFAATLLG